MARLRVLGENPPPPRGNGENQLRELRDYLTRLKDELEFLMTHLGEDNFAESLATWVTDTSKSVESINASIDDINGEIGDINTALAGKQDTLTFDDTPTSGSDNPVKSGGVYSALSGKQDTLTFDNSPTNGSSNPVKSGGVYTALSGKQNTLTFDDAPASGSNNPVKSGGIYTALSGKQDTLTFDDAPVPYSENPVKSSGLYIAFKDNEIRVVDCGTLSNSDPNTDIGFGARLQYTSGDDYKLISYDLGNPDALLSDLTVDLDRTGNLFVYGRIYGSTTLILYFARAVTAT